MSIEKRLQEIITDALHASNRRLLDELRPMLRGRADAATSEDDLTVPEAASILKVEQTTVRQWCRSDVLQAYKLGGKHGPWRIRRASLDRLKNTDDDGPVDFEERAHKILALRGKGGGDDG